MVFGTQNATLIHRICHTRLSHDLQSIVSLVKLLSNPCPHPNQNTGRLNFHRALASISPQYIRTPSSSSSLSKPKGSDGDDAGEVVMGRRMAGR